MYLVWVRHFGQWGIKMKLGRYELIRQVRLWPNTEVFELFGP